MISLWLDNDRRRNEWQTMGEWRVEEERREREEGEREREKRERRLFCRRNEGRCPRSGQPGKGQVRANLPGRAGGDFLNSSGFVGYLHAGNAIKTICSVQLNEMYIYIYSRKQYRQDVIQDNYQQQHALCTERNEMSSLINHSVPPVGMASSLRITTPVFFFFFTISYIVSSRPQMPTVEEIRV